MPLQEFTLQLTQMLLFRIFERIFGWKAKTDSKFSLSSSLVQSTRDGKIISKTAKQITVKKSRTRCDTTSSVYSFARQQNNWDSFKKTVPSKNVD